MLAGLLNKKSAPAEPVVPQPQPQLPPESITELPNFQKYSKSLNPHGSILYECTSTSKSGTDDPLKYTVRILPWTHAKYFHYIPYEVYTNAEGSLATVAKVKHYESSVASQFQTKMTIEFERGVFPINLQKFMEDNKFMTAESGMKISRLEAMKCLEALISPRSAAGAAAGSVDDHVVETTSKTIDSEPSNKPAGPAGPAAAPAASAAPKKRFLEDEVPLLDLIEVVEKVCLFKFDVPSMLSTEGKQQYQKEIESKFSPEVIEFAAKIRTNKRLFTEAFFSNISPDVKRLCSLPEND